jgi:hypothetical protein
MRILQGLIFLALWMLGSTSYASGDNESCEPLQDALSPTEYLRALSLDLRGELPSLDDLQAVEASGQVDPAMIESMMETPEFAWQVVELHRTLLWPYIDHQNFYPMALKQDWDTRLYYRQTGVVHWPEVYGRGGENVRCRDEPEPDPTNIQPIENPDGTVQEGWTCVTPYFEIWNDTWLDSDDDCPLGQIKVCAYDAQEALVSPNNGLSCTSAVPNPDPGCGCGPNMRHCAKSKQFHSAILESYDRSVHWMVANNRPYHEMFSEAPLFVNGPMTSYLTYFAPDLPFSTAILPDLNYLDDEDTWVALPSEPAWTGVLNHLVYRLRFMSNRARVARFYKAFLCSPFQPPVGALPPATDEAMQEPDLQKRPGCKYCHSTIEPAAAYWGTWGEYRPRYLNAEDYPDYDPECHDCALAGTCGERCVQQYVTAANIPEAVPYLGFLNAYLFLAEEHQVNISGGTQLLVEKTLLDGRLPDCAVRNFAIWLMGRDLLPDEESWLETLSDVFAASDYDVKSLVYAIVTSDFYRRVL